MAKHLSKVLFKITMVKTDLSIITIRLANYEDGSY